MKPFKLKIINEQAPDFASSVGITEERRIELSKQMDEQSKSFKGQRIRACNMFNDILSLCKNLEEIVYCVHIHTCWLLETGTMRYAK